VVNEVLLYSVVRLVARTILNVFGPPKTARQGRLASLLYHESCFAKSRLFKRAHFWGGKV